MCCFALCAIIGAAVLKNGERAEALIFAAWFETSGMEEAQCLRSGVVFCCLAGSTRRKPKNKRLGCHEGAAFSEEKAALF